VSDDGQVECVVGQRELRGRRDLDLDEHAGVLGRFLRAPRGRLVRRDQRGAAGQADLAGHRRQPSAVRAADLQERVAHLHAGHADDQQIRVAFLQKHVHRS